MAAITCLFSLLSASEAVAGPGGSVACVAITTVVLPHLVRVAPVLPKHIEKGEEVSFLLGDSHTQAVADAGPFSPRHAYTGIHKFIHSGAPWQAPGNQFGLADSLVVLVTVLLLHLRPQCLAQSWLGSSCVF